MTHRRWFWVAGFLAVEPGLWGLAVVADPRPEHATPLPPYQRQLRGERARQAHQLEDQIEKAWAAARFEEALKAAEAVTALRAKAQGEDHWQTVNAHWQVQALRRIVPQDAATRQAMARARAQTRVALDQQRRAGYRQAQVFWEKALALYRRVLGDEHPDTATACNNLGLNLVGQGEYVAAQPLLENALAICRKALGEEHPKTAYAYINLAFVLDARGKYTNAELLYRRSLATLRKVVGEEDPDTAQAYNNLALNLHKQGQYGAAAQLNYKALGIFRKALGEADHSTAVCYNNLALNLNADAKYTAAEPLYRKALAIYRRALGDDHPDTAQYYNNLAGNLYGQGRYAAAQPLFEKALAIRRQALGEDHPLTAQSYNTLAGNLDAQGQYAAAQPLIERALAIRRRALGDDHPDTANAYNNLAVNLLAQRRYADAQLLCEKALAIDRKALGEEHPETAVAYYNLANNLRAQRQYAAAQPLMDKALAIRRKSLGAEHPETAASYNSAGGNLNAQGQYAAAQPLIESALAIWRKVLGDTHPRTALGYDNLAYDCYCQGKYVEAQTYWAKAAEAFARARLLVAGAGLERAAVTSERSPLLCLAAILARNGRPGEAWRRFEESLAGGTWDDLSARLRRAPAERDRQTALVQELRRLDQFIERTPALKDTPASRSQREQLLTERRKKGEELAALLDLLEKAYGPAAGQVYDQLTIQTALPADAALIGWVDIEGQPKAADPSGEHWAVILRSRGQPAWQRLRGSGKDATWTQADSRLPAQLGAALRDPNRDWQALADRLRAQRLQPPAGQLAARDGLPAVRRLIVLPSPALAGVPLEVCAPHYTVSYAPSGTIFAYLRGLPPAAGRGMLALADPVFDAGRHKPGRAPLPPGGLLVTLVVPGGNASRAGLHPDDVILCYAGGELKDLAELGRLIQQHARDKEVHVTVWRAGQTRERTVAGGPLGVALARQPAPAALAERYKNDQLLAQSRAGAEGDWPELPGTRAEAEKLRQLCAGANLPFRLLADSDASEQELDRLARTKDLSHFRYVHLATHGDLDDRLPLQSAVILARDHLPDPLRQLEAGRPVYTGRLTAEEVLEGWDLHADLVTFSACQTALGKYEGGEGFVGFTQALLLSGARSVCLSLWKVDDTATALLMQRFYANLLGQRPGLKKPLGKAEALAEAKTWLRELTAEEEAQRVASLTQGVARGKGRKALPPPTVVKGPGADKTAKPYAHPYYWAAFVLVGDRD
jgi:Tfp pilus assembly protein PilF